MTKSVQHYMCWLKREALKPEGRIRLFLRLLPLAWPWYSLTLFWRSHLLLLIIFVILMHSKRWATWACFSSCCDEMTPVLAAARNWVLRCCTALELAWFRFSLFKVWSLSTCSSLFSTVSASSLRLLTRVSPNGWLERIGWGGGKERYTDIDGCSINKFSSGLEATGDNPPTWDPVKHGGGATTQGSLRLPQGWYVAWDRPEQAENTDSGRDSVSEHLSISWLAHPQSCSGDRMDSEQASVSGVGRQRSSMLCSAKAAASSRSSVSEAFDEFWDRESCPKCIGCEWWT